jgi:putative acetyltransferase
MPVPIRPMGAADLPRLAVIYRSAIRTLGPAHYTPEQVAMWSAFADDTAGFATWFASGTAIVAEGASTVDGFGILQPSGRLAALFVAPEAVRRGIGSALTSWMLSEARRLGLERVTTEASAFSEPLFRRMGFRSTGQETVTRGGVVFERCCMAIDLSTG